MGRGLYIHIPFCAAKCAYCDFYSFKATDSIMDDYVDEVISRLSEFREYDVETLYIGGGTPTLLGAKRLQRLLKATSALGNFTEATIEANPADDLYDTLSAALDGGINRLSLGIQTAVESELALLSRRHNNMDVERTFETAHKVGIDNISADVMLAIPNQTTETLDTTLDFIGAFNPKHISAYLLKLEQGTPLYENRDNLPLPDDDTAAALYLQCCNRLKAMGYGHYEVSNFAKDGYESQHNTNYWRCGEYIGIGAAAYGFLEGKRYFFERDIKAFINGAPPVSDGIGGTAQEQLMLGLRLKDGISSKNYCRQSGCDLAAFTLFCEMLAKNGLAEFSGDRLTLTDNGFLVSNEIIAQLSQIK